MASPASDLVPWSAPLWRAPGPLNPLNPQRAHSVGFLHREPVCRPTLEIDRPPSLESIVSLSPDPQLHTPCCSYILLARRFAAPLRFGLVCKASAFKGFVSLPVLVGRLFLSSPCPPVFVLPLRQLLLRQSSFQLLPVSPASISQSRSPHRLCGSRSFFCAALLKYSASSSFLLHLRSLPVLLLLRF